jgi:hypothetical protein
VIACRYNPFTPRRFTRLCQKLFVESLALLPETQPPATNRTFSTFGAQATLSAAKNADDTAFLWWLGLDKAGVHWTVQVFVQCDWHEWNQGPQTPIAICRICTLTPDQILSGATMAQLTRAALDTIDAKLAEANRTGFFDLLDRDFDYSGPRVVRSVRIVPRPDYFEKLQDALTVSI